MKRKLLFFGLLAAIAVVTTVYLQSCKHESTEHSMDKDPMFTPLSIAKEVAENINKSEIVINITDKSLLKSDKYQGKRKIKNSRTITDKQKTPYFYVFNYDSGGYSIVPADQRMNPNLAYGETGSFNLDSLPSGVIKWLDENAQYIKYLRTTNAKQSTGVNYLWSNAQGSLPSSSDLKSTNNIKPPPCQSSSTSVTVGPLLLTSWGQGCYYNDICPLSSDGPCGHAYTGCVATATAQVMAYWKYPLTYNWSQMPATYGSSETARLMYDIGKAVNMNYGGYSAGGSSAPSSNIGGSLVGVFGYSSATYTGNYNSGSYQTVVSNLDHKWPVILSGCTEHSTFLGIETWVGGDCHAWVCDGYVQSYVTNCDDGVSFSYGTLMFHMNWGWHEYGATNNVNGWYAYNLWAAPNGDTFQYGIDMVYNIHP